MGDCGSGDGGLGDCGSGDGGLGDCGSGDSCFEDCCLGSCGSVHSWAEVGTCVDGQCWPEPIVIILPAVPVEVAFNCNNRL